MWLLVAAPTITRVLPVPHAMAMAMGDECPEHAGGQHPSAPDKSSPHMDLCGYCVLAGESPWLAGGVSVLSVASSSPALPPAVHSVIRWYARPSQGARPRGPPSSPIA